MVECISIYERGSKDRKKYYFNKNEINILTESEKSKVK